MLFNFGGKKATPPPAPVAPKPVGFAYDLVGSDVEFPKFDPWQLSVDKSEETINWYRAAELKV
jgi:hypothetical protein